MESYEFGRKLANDNMKSVIIGDIKGLYGVGNIDPYFLYVLSLRGILWGMDENRELILPNTDKSIQSQVLAVKSNLIKLLDINPSQVKLGDFRKISISEDREPYMRTPYYFDRKYIENNIKILELVRKFGDKVLLSEFIKKNNLDHLLPNNTIITDSWDNLLNEIKNRFNSKKSFVVKAGEGASGENIVLVRFTDNNIYISSSQCEDKLLLSYSNLIECINKAIPKNSRYKYGCFCKDGYKENIKVSQKFLIQDLVDIKKYQEKSVNFYITLDKEIYPITYGKNIAENGVHKGNIEEVLPEFILEEIYPLLKEISKAGYYGPIGFDIFVNFDEKKLKIIEANTRYTAPISPSMLVYKLQKQGKLPKNYTWKSIQKFEVTKDLTLISSLKKYNLVDILLKEKEIKGSYFVCYSPVFGKKYQSVIIIGPNQESITELENIIRKNLFSLR